ncbi:MAG: SH3 domain-containing protein [Verrucomicrobiota bacterium]|nr:SH3 domain-containing protein [Verrucomicrobiota bacterium]
MSFVKTVSIVALSFALQAAPAAAPAKTAALIAAEKKSFKPFTGKVVANKVRLRVKPDLDSHIIRQVSKNDLLLVVGEEGDFYAVQPSKETKAYVFRSYILDNVVEANRVNIRLEPQVDGPIIGQLQAGDRIQGQVCPMNHKWLEIAAPNSTRFYISKEFLTQVGGPDYLISMEKRKSQVEEALNAAYAAAETECKKEYEEMAPQALIDQFQAILRNFADFPEAVNQAKEGLATLKETYLQKKISFLESRSELSPVAKQELLAKHQAESRELLADGQANTGFFAKRAPKKEMTDQMRYWDTIEESLYLSWTAFHTGRKLNDFYGEQKANATVLTGTVEAYDRSVRNRPGDYVLRSDEAPTAYLYSTSVNLEKYEGKQVTLLASPRPNNHFAFPAYFVLSVE